MKLHLASTPAQPEALRQIVARGEELAGNGDLAQWIRDEITRVPGSELQAQASSHLAMANDDAYTTDAEGVVKVDAADGVLANDVQDRDSPVAKALASSEVTGDDQGDWQAQVEAGASTSDPMRPSDDQEDSDKTQASLVGQPLDTGTAVLAGTWQVQLVTPPAHGTLSLKRDGSFTYTAAANFHGTDEFVYRIVASQLQSRPATVRITVAPRASVDGTTVDHRLDANDDTQLFPLIS